MATPKCPDVGGATAPCQPSPSVESSGYMEPDAGLGLHLSVTGSSLLARRLLRLRSCRSYAGPTTRRKREMIPADKKDSTYWDKRQKNNEAAKRSREKRRLNDLILEGQLLALSEENAQLRAHVLSLQYHTEISAEKSKAAFLEPTSSPPDAAATLPLSPRPAHTNALFQARHWGNSPSASLLGVTSQQTAGLPFQTNTPCFNPAVGAGGFHPPATHSCAISPQAALNGRRSTVPEMDAQRQVSSSGISHSAYKSSHPDFRRHAASTLAYTPQNWLVPKLGHSPVCNNLLLPWRPYVPPPSIYPGLPLYIHDRRGQALLEEADLQGGLRSRLSSGPAGLHLSPDGR
uniref:Si:dkey-172o19.2 n=1 Tax=Echeneis naucrates TaxID=173247 RepID=A0A665WIU8_ECHNA